MLALYSFLIVFCLIILAFEVWMLIETIKNRVISPEEKALWIVGMLFIHPFVAIAYYFMRRSNLSSS